MRAARLRNYVEIQELRSTQDAYGAEVKAWVTIDETWAAIEPTGGKEIIAGGQLSGEQTAQVIMRYSPYITEKMRINHDGTIWTIEAPPIDERNEHKMMTLVCKSGLKNA